MQETLLTAARRAVRFFNIDMNKGGIITPETQHAVETLDRMVHRAAEAEKRAQKLKEEQHAGA
jgi:hypothetical protein